MRLVKSDGIDERMCCCWEKLSYGKSERTNSNLSTLPNEGKVCDEGLAVKFPTCIPACLLCEGSVLSTDFFRG